MVWKRTPVLLLTLCSLVAAPLDSEAAEGQNIDANQFVALPRGDPFGETFPIRTGAYPSRWAKLTSAQMKKVREVQNFIMQRARATSPRNPEQARELKHWADKMDTITFQVKPDPGAFLQWWSGGKPEMSRTRFTNRINIYQDFWANTMEMHLNSIAHPDQAELDGIYGEVASAFIHEMRHTEGYGEFGAYTYEWKMFQALGVPTEGDMAVRYDKVRTQLTQVVGAGYSAGTDTWHFKKAGLRGGKPLRPGSPLCVYE